MMIFSAPAEIDNRQALAGLVASMLLVAGISLTARIFLKDNHTASAQQAGTECSVQAQCSE